MPSKSDLLRLIPKVDDLINNEKITEAAQSMCRQVVLESIREQVDETRKKILLMEESETAELDVGRLVDEIIARALGKNEMSLKRVINATGVILHTNLGRAPLNAGVKDAVWEIAENYSTLEYSIGTGSRGSRYDHVQGLIAKLAGAEAAFAVNNNAAAVLLVLSTLAKGCKVAVSRGELVEIGGSFRVPEIMEQSGARLVEVGSTNKTRISDYRKAMEEGDVGALLKVHTSNYKIVGFTEEVELAELVKLGEEYGIPVIHDLGSGALIDLGKYGISGEPTVQESMLSGADVVCFSGDKLLGGPQAGIIAGKKSLIDKMKKNPLTRAFRIDKLSLAALEATLRLYLDPDSAVSSIPVLSMMTMPIETIEARSATLCSLLAGKLQNCDVFVEDGHSQVGGGAMPLQNLPSKIVNIKPAKLTVQELETRLRGSKPPVIARIHKDHVCLDVRTMRDEDFPLVASAFEEALGKIWE
ncbi:MAG: L-seryl-tRNA(Sec) selenium transferase [Clostridiales bacterium]|nr:L-seryl-tRNA(Sec) selenium transferase [Clostridiales bacterium]